MTCHGLTFRLLWHEHPVETRDGFRQPPRHWLAGLCLDGDGGADRPLEVPICTSSPLRSMLSAMRISSRETGAEAAAFAAQA
jgi:hypothetical protein